MTYQRSDMTGFMAEWATELRSEFVVELPAAQVAAVATLAAEAGTGIAVSLIEGGLSMSSTFGASTGATAGATTGASAGTAAAATAAAGLKAKIAAGTLAAALTAGGAAAATGNLPDGAQSFTADVAASIGLELPRPETTVGLFARTDIAADEFITVSTVGRIGVALDGDALVLTDIMGNAGVSASVVAETTDSIIVEFVSETEVASVVVTSTGQEILADISRTAFDLDSESGVVIQTPVGTVESGGSTSGEGSVSGSNDGGAEPGDGETGGAVVGVETDATADVTVEQCAALGAAADAAGDLGIGLTGGGTETVIGSEGTADADAFAAACASLDAEVEGSAGAGAGSDG